MRAPCLCSFALLAACGRADSRPNVLLVTLDTLRADHVGAYDERAHTPNLDRLAAQATVFERATAPMPMTLPSHFSMFTGRYPREHGVLSNALSLPDSARSLAEVLSESGYQTGAFVSVSLLDDDSGAAQGFATFDHPGEELQRIAGDTVPRALRWLAERPGERPYFLWVHLFDPHLPYEPPEPYRAELDPALASEHPTLDGRALFEVAKRHGGDVPGPYLDHARKLYRGEVAYLDAWVGELLEGVGKDTLTVVVADHGECFENGRYFTHADSLQEGALHIPFFLRYPAAFPPGTRVRQQVSLVDLVPTLLDVLGMPPMPGVSGRSLRGLEEDGERFVLIQHPLYSGKMLAQHQGAQHVIRSVAGQPTREVESHEHITGVVGGGWKYLRTGAGVEQLYRLEDETREESAHEPARLAALRAEHERMLQAHPLTVLESGDVDPALLRELQDLGYAE